MPLGQNGEPRMPPLRAEREYLEEKIDSIEPSWGKDVKGIHTINSVNKLTIFDAKLRLKR